MDTQLLIIFIVLNILNVIIQTVKSIATVKCGKAVAALEENRFFHINFPYYCYYCLKK